MNLPVVRKGLSARALLAGGAAALVILASACSSSSYNTPTATAAKATSQPTTPAATGSPAASAVVAVHQLPSVGTVLTTASGMTLYTFKRDTPGTSNCTASCAQTWPPLTTTDSAVPPVTGASGSFSLIKRSDGRMQVAYNGDPLYTYSGDTQPGQDHGQGFGGVWFVATAGGASTASPTPTPNSGAGGYNY